MDVSPPTLGPIYLWDEGAVELEEASNLRGELLEGAMGIENHSPKVQQGRNWGVG